MWYDYGCFCLRSQQQGKAEQCLREAVALDPTSQPSLLALASLLWHHGIHTDAAHLDQAETILHAAKESSSDDACVWALLTLLYASLGPRRASEHRNAAFETHRLAQAQQSPGAAHNPYLQVGAHTPAAVLLEQAQNLHSPNFAETCFHRKLCTQQLIPVSSESCFWQEKGSTCCTRQADMITDGGCHMQAPGQGVQHLKRCLRHAGVYTTSCMTNMKCLGCPSVPNSMMHMPATHVLCATQLAEA